MTLPSLPPRYLPSPSSGAQLLAGREAAELGLLLAVRRGAQPREVGAAWALLAPYYGDARSSLPPSPREARLQALRLLALLLDPAGRAGYYEALEEAPPALLEAPEVARVTAIEADLARGAYRRTLRVAPADDDEAPLLARLADAARLGAARCAAAAYGPLAAADAADLLGLDSPQELAQFAARAAKDSPEAAGWVVDLAADRVDFAPEERDAKGDGLQAERIISNCLAYAKELERIV